MNGNRRIEIETGTRSGGELNAEETDLTGEAGVCQLCQRADRQAVVADEEGVGGGKIGLSSRPNVRLKASVVVSWTFAEPGKLRP